MKFRARKREDGTEQALIDHLFGVSKRAEKFAEAFGAGMMGARAGLLHDIGKYSEEFQARLDGKNIKCDHSTAGAQLVAKKYYDQITAFCIAGHHAGLADYGNTGDTADNVSLQGRLKKTDIPDYSAYKTEVADIVEEVSVPRFLNQNAFSDVTFVRMLYSCLVDADFLDTEAFMDPANVYRGGHESIENLYNKLNEHCARWGEPTTELNRLREKVRKACKEKGKSPRGLFGLTVPTGGGKTVSSLAFALEHARKNGMERVIYVIPYTSIIDQTVDVFRTILGKESVLAHYYNMQHAQQDETIEEDMHRLKQRLATENWDVPVVVTTSVQFFESLFAARSSHCRKLHHIANSVIIFDEAQMLPQPYLIACVRMIVELVKNYRASAIFCTATQPSLDKIIQNCGFTDGITEIYEDYRQLYEALRRTTLVWEGRLAEQELVQRLEECEQVLCVVNTRAHAQKLYQQLKGEGTFHLSTLMTPSHRRQTIQQIRSRLQAGEKCRVISTSLIEAGVDIDFPKVYREIAGLDSIIQAAGRCNREGKRSPEESQVHIFESEEFKIPKNQKIYAQTMKEVTEKAAIDTWASPDVVYDYFQQLFYNKGEKSLDAKEIMENVEKLRLRQVAHDFKLIEEDTIVVYIPTKENEKDLALMREGLVSRSLYQRLSNDAVSIYRTNFDKMEQDVEIIGEGTMILINKNKYDEKLGLCIEEKNMGLLMN